MSDARHNNGGGLKGLRGRGPMELSASLEADLTAAQAADLHVGDIVVCEVPADRPDGIDVTVRVAGIPKFIGKLGASAGRRAVTIEGEFRATEE